MNKALESRRLALPNRVVLLMACLVLALGGCQPAPSTSIEPPAGWTKVSASEFVFHVPPDMKLVPTQAEDSEGALYRGDSI
jgi:hypothetical protein